MNKLTQQEYIHILEEAVLLQDKELRQLRDQLDLANATTRALLSLLGLKQ